MTEQEEKIVNDLIRGNDELREIVQRFVNYCTEDKATTRGSTRLARLLEECSRNRIELGLK